MSPEVERFKQQRVCGVARGCLDGVFEPAVRKNTEVLPGDVDCEVVEEALSLLGVVSLDSNLGVDVEAHDLGDELATAGSTLPVSRGDDEPQFPLLGVVAKGEDLAGNAGQLSHSSFMRAIFSPQPSID